MFPLSWLSDSLREFWERGDKLLLALCLAASGFGLVLIYSATRWNNDNRSVVVQALGIFLGVLVYIALSTVDLELFVEKSWKWLLAFNVVLILALIPFGWGDTATGNKNWISIPGTPLNVQPAEVAKLTFILLLAWQCARLQKKGISRPSSVFQLVAHTGLMGGLIAVVSGDMGMTLVYLFLFVMLAWTSGVRLRWFVLGAAVCAGGVAVIWPRISDKYFAKRITVVIDHITGNPATLVEQTQGKGWQQTRSILAIGSGGLTGQGYLQGIQTQSPYKNSLIARSTDNIFAVCGEELGLVGCILVILILAAIIARCLWVAGRASSPMAALAATGYAGMLLFQSALNIGMCLYVLPIVGLTLPFFSYGGTSVITMFAAMGAVSSIKTRSLPSWLSDRSKL
ncbi:FtsW/RodA/SpoVE family cell cycle protein [Candidatus Pseudoscillospira sp. SGI.172]|mgnify:CR=1 FL=1|uniref:FtsW/RodA/SpoVE family cell cycle protein n=1 Tax=Candidatus Pseudoscillospira sp. SGI.172 TaxID=3420582 RepID=UPI003D02E83B